MVDGKGERRGLKIDEDVSMIYLPLRGVTVMVAVVVMNLQEEGY